ncbi:autotransporter-associated beta strand repeat-containing protein, partial [Bradyrhizobium sp.]|uniref:autotransporter-associated beta strand repeat-containing protein n=1 Tax=Bradyrhizobium sp. TaxID=376 RepID=UPI0039E4140F
MQFWDGADTTGNGRVDGGAGTWGNFGSNWTTSDGSANGSWAGSVGIFAGTAGTVTVQGVQSFDTLQFSTDGYRLEGDALKIAVAGGGTFNIDRDVTATIASDIVDGAGSSLVKAGDGTLVLEGAKSYSGGTAINGGVLSVAADNSLGAASGALSLNGGTLAATASFDSLRTVTLGTGGGFDVASGVTLGLQGSISGAGDLLKQGAGTLILAGANAYG